MVKKDKVTVLLDMDGVITDIVSGIEYLYNTKFDFTKGESRFTKLLGITMAELSSDLDQSKFWTDLKPTSYMNQIFQILKDYGLYHRTILCTQGIFMPEAHAGRLRWIQHHCPELWIRKAYISIQDKSMLANKHMLLIDDYHENCKKFMQAGGWAITFMADWNPLQKGNPVERLESELETLFIAEDEDEEI